MNVSLCYFTVATDSKSGGKKWSVLFCSQIRSRQSFSVQESLMLFELGTPVSHRIQTTCLKLYYSRCLRTVMLGKCLNELGHCCVTFVVWYTRYKSLLLIPNFSTWLISAPATSDVLFCSHQKALAAQRANAPRLGPFHLSSNAFVSAGPCSWGLTAHNSFSFFVLFGSAGT